MNYLTHDTVWAESQLGNSWRRQDGIPLIVGKHKGATHFWASIDHVFLKDVFNTLEEAMAAVDEEAERRQKKWMLRNEY
jgi:hypothetical protein